MVYNTLYSPIYSYTFRFVKKTFKNPIPHNTRQENNKNNSNLYKKKTVLKRLRNVL